MYGSFDWTADIMPVITDFMSQNIIVAGVSLLIGLALAVYATRALISVFFKRE